MNRLRLAAALTGLGALATCPFAAALAVPEPSRDETAGADRSASAMHLLRQAAERSRVNSWQATQRVLSFASGAPVMSVAEVGHGRGMSSSTQSLDTRLFSLLGEHYDVVVAGASPCEGRRATLIEARRETGDAAARFWVDTATGMVLRRDVHDERGALLRRTDLVGLSVFPDTAVETVAMKPQGVHLDDMALRTLESDGWPVPRALPGHLALYDARWLVAGVLQLAYSDGLSTLSLFVQQGEKEPTGSGAVRQVGGGTVWMAPGEPERAAWVAQGLTWTLVSDAPPELIDEVLLALPHSAATLTEDALAPRVWRGMNRVGAWLNPFA